GRDGQRARRDADPRRLRPDDRVRRGAALPRQPGPRNRRGHHRGAAHAHRTGAGTVSGTDTTVEKRIVQRGLWFEEFELGAIYEHRPGRTITEADNTLFTTQTMNTQALHLDAAYAAETSFGERLVNSMFTLST